MVKCGRKINVVLRYFFWVFFGRFYKFCFWRHVDVFSNLNTNKIFSKIIIWKLWIYIIFSYIQLVIFPYLIFNFFYKYKCTWKLILKFDNGHAWTIFCGTSKGPRLYYNIEKEALPSSTPPLILFETQNDYNYSNYHLGSIRIH